MPSSDVLDRHILRFKLASSLEKSLAAPIAAVTGPEANSTAVSVSPGDIDALRTLNEESRSYTEGSIVGGNPAYYQVPIKSPFPPQAASYSSSIVEDILVGPASENMVWKATDVSGTLMECNNEHLTLVDLKTNRRLPAAVQYSSDGTAWSSSDDSLKYVRFVFAAEDLVGAIPLASFAVLGNDGPIFYHRLVTPVARFTDFSVQEAISAGAVTTYVLRFHKSNYESEFDITNNKVITWQNNPLSNIEVILPRRKKTQAWNFQVRRATEILPGAFVSTVNLLGNRPTVVKDEVPTRVTPALLKLGQKDVNVISGGAIIDLETNWAVGIHLTINGDDKTGSILDVNEKNGYVLLSQPVSGTASILVSYAVDSTKWVEFSFDLNPKIERRNLKPPWMSFDVDDSSYSLYLQKGTLGPDFLIGPSARLNRLYQFSGDLTDPRDAPAVHLPRRPHHISIATLSVQSPKSSTVVDVRRPGGGLKPEYRRDNRFDLKSHTSLGFYDGQPTQENVIIIKMPLEVYRSVYNRYIESDSNEQLPKSETFTVPKKILTLAKKAYFSYVGYDWPNRVWDNPPITVRITDSVDTYSALDMTNYSNLADTPTLPDYSAAEQYLFYYYRGAIHLNSSDYVSASVDYKYVEDEVFNREAHTAASKYIGNSLEALLPAGTYYILQDTDGKPYPATKRNTL